MGTNRPILEEARQRLGSVATGLCRKLDPLDVAGSFAAIGAEVLAHELGRKEAANYLRKLADELERDAQGRFEGHA